MVPAVLLLAASAVFCPGAFAEGPIGAVETASSDGDRVLDSSQKPSTTGWLALRDVDVLTMTSEQLLTGQTVLIHGDRIEALGPTDEVAVPEEAQLIDGRGRTLLPGLMDLHVHLDEELGVRPDFADGPLYLAHGVTSVLNLRGDETHLEWRRRVEAGEVLAPTVFTSGGFLNEPTFATPDEVEQEVRRQAEAGYDVVKFHEIYSPEEHRYLTTVGLSREAYDRMITTARDEGITLLGHAPHNLGFEPVLDMGQSLAHLNALVEHHLIPDGSPEFARFAKLTKWSALVVVATAMLALGVAAIGRKRAGSGCSRFPWGLILASLGSGGLFLALWEHTVWAGNNWLIGMLSACGLVIVGTAVLLARRLAKGEGPRSMLLALLLPSIVLASTLVYWLPLTWRNSEGQIEAMAEALHEADVSIVTTLIVDSLDWLHADHPELRYVSAASGWQDFEPFQYSAPWWAPNLRVGQWRFLERKLVAPLYRAGVPLLLGTDSMGFSMIIPGISVHYELTLLREAGLTPFEALRIATVLPARFLGQENEVGSIAPGLRADLLLVDGNPLEDLTSVTRPSAVIVRGRWLERSTLDGWLETLAESGTSQGK